MAERGLTCRLEIRLTWSEKAFGASDDTLSSIKGVLIFRGVVPGSIVHTCLTEKVSRVRELHDIK